MRPAWQQFRAALTAESRTLNAEELQRLYAATQSTLHMWVDRMQTEAAEKFPEKVTAFRPEMAVHGRYGLPCPRTGDELEMLTRQ